MGRKNRAPDQIRELTLERRFTENVPGSVLVRGGKTVVLCTASLEDGVPPFLMNTNRGWLTAEYSMLPGSTKSRKARDGRRPYPDARSLEIGRLIGRSLRAACDFSKMPGRTIWVDCDVLQADGGTRTLSISGAMVALTDACKEAERRGWLRGWPIVSPVAAISAGIVRGEALVDLDYSEDSNAEVDMNVVMNDKEEFVEIQSSAEKGTFNGGQLESMLGLCSQSIREILELQTKVLAD